MMMTVMILASPSAKTHYMNEVLWYVFKVTTTSNILNSSSNRNT
jgi:hypothetical protein